MRKEIAQLGRLVRSTVMLGGVTYGLLAPLINFNTSEQVLTALRGGTVDCTAGTEDLNAYYQYSAIAIPGAGMYFDEKAGMYLPNDYERGRLTAAALLYINGYAPTVIILDGQLPHGALSTSAAYLQHQVYELSGWTKRLPDESVLLDDTSINTATNMQELHSLGKGWLRKVLIVTDDFHLDRSVIEACSNDIHATGISVGDTFTLLRPSLKSAYMAHRSPVEEFIRSVKEETEIALLPWDTTATGETLAKNALIYASQP